MGLRQREWAMRKRVELLQALGGVCWRCGSPYDLEIDHPDGRDWNPRLLDMGRRVTRYWREYRSGVPLQALCKECNSRGKHEHFPRPTLPAVTDANEPF